MDSDNHTNFFNNHATKDSKVSNKAYSDALDWLFSQLPMFSRIGAAAYKPGLQTTEALDRIFGQPHKKFKSIHVGGTNGKGSTSHSLAAALQANGYKVGLYTSPHLVDFRERMRINGEMIPHEAVIEFVEKWRAGMHSHLRPSFFELTMMMAFKWFAAEGIDYAIIEVGMGGRLDSTNVISPVMSVITNISKDHVQFLGDTLEKIAGEKAGIIKPGIPVVIGETVPSTRNVFLQKATSEESPIIFAEEDGDLLDIKSDEDGSWESSSATFGAFKFPLQGEYQKKNLNTVLTALRELKDRNIISLDTAKTVSGLEQVISLTGLRGRWEVVRRDPLAVCDTGHNTAGLSATLSQLQRLSETDGIQPGCLRFVIGFVNDKDVDHIVPLFPKDAEYYFTQPSIPRAMQASKVAEIFASNGIRGTVYPTVSEAYEGALAASNSDDIIYIGGSTFIVADFLAR